MRLAKMAVISAILCFNVWGLVVLATQWGYYHDVEERAFAQIDGDINTKAEEHIVLRWGAARDEWLRVQWAVIGVLVAANLLAGGAFCVLCRWARSARHQESNDTTPS